jgi:pimeloyl-ACP methyl ester carboxylesterase
MVMLVLLPGMDGTGELFAPLVAALGPQQRVKVVRYPAAVPLGYAELEAIARASLPTNEPFIVLGESFSGPIAASLAASRPPNLKGLVLCCSFLRNPQPSLAWLRPLVNVSPVAAAPIGLLAWLLLGRFSTGVLKAALVRSLAQVSAPALRARLRSVLSVDVSEKFASVAVPTLYLRASHDRIVPPSASRLVLRLKPDARVVQLEAPHFLLQASPSEAASAVRRFIEDLQRTAFERAIERFHPNCARNGAGALLRCLRLHCANRP